VLLLLQKVVLVGVVDLRRRRTKVRVRRAVIDTSDGGGRAPPCGAGLRRPCMLCSWIRDASSSSSSSAGGGGGGAPSPRGRAVVTATARNGFAPSAPSDLLAEGLGSPMPFLLTGGRVVGDTVVAGGTTGTPRAPCCETCSNDRLKRGSSSSRQAAAAVRECGDGAAAPPRVSVGRASLRSREAAVAVSQGRGAIESIHVSVLWTLTSGIDFVFLFSAKENRLLGGSSSISLRKHMWC
jgi:hypothetical protein